MNRLPVVLSLALLPALAVANPPPKESATPAPAASKDAPAPKQATPAAAAPKQELSPPPTAPDMAVHAMKKAAELQWGDAPPAFERGAQAAVVSGDPAKAGSLFVIRLKAPAGFRIARHWHPSDEHVTVLEGDLSLDMGEGADQHTASFGPGDYVLLPAKMQHAASTTGGVTLQVHGMGPLELVYVDPKDDPRKRAPKAAEKQKGKAGK